MEGHYQRSLSELGDISDWSVQDVLTALEVVLGDSSLTSRLATGNVEFLQRALDYATQVGLERFAASKYPAGVKAHLRRALPHQFGFVASADREVENSLSYFQVIASRIRSVDELAPEDLIDVARTVVSSKQLSRVCGQHPNMETLGRIVSKHDRLVREEGPELALEYLNTHARGNRRNDRAQSIRNILVKSFLPNLEGYIARLGSPLSH